MINWRDPRRVQAALTPHSWELANADTPKKFNSLMRGDFAQLKFVTTAKPSDCENLWVKVIGRTNKRNEYWAEMDDVPRLIKDMFANYEKRSGQWVYLGQQRNSQCVFKPSHVIDFIARDSDDIALVDLWGVDWGWYKRSEESDFPIQCSFGQIQDRHDIGVIDDGCYRGKTALRQISRGIAYKNNNERHIKFDRALKSICKKSREILWVYYVVQAPLREKVDALEITVHEYFPALRIAQEEILAVIVRDGAAPHE